jgi:hypothetical protein
LNSSPAIWGLLAFAVAAANLPWLSSNLLLVVRLAYPKSAWLRVLEWFAGYLLTGFLALGMERKLTGAIHTQDWEFYVVTLFLFAVLALPGFIYRHEFRRHRRRH